MKVVYIGIALGALIIGGFLLFGKSQPSVEQQTQKTNQQQPVFVNPKKSAHFESNTPAHGAILAGVPVNVVADFNFDLAKPSSVKIEKNGQDFGAGETIIDENKLSMRRKMDSSSPNGIYTVDYNACWPDGSCHQGNFQFAIDRNLSQKFEDQTNKKEVEIKMSQIAFQPQNIKVSKGTKITWINDDMVEHYVNSDSHPAHSYFKEQNSKSLKKGESYSVILAEAGIYPYHCSAHASQMSGNILVE